MYHIVSSGTQTGSSATNLSLKPSKAVLDKTKPKEKKTPLEQLLLVVVFPILSLNKQYQMIYKNRDPDALIRECTNTGLLDKI